MSARSWMRGHGWSREAAPASQVDLCPDCTTTHPARAAAAQTTTPNGE